MINDSQINSNMNISKINSNVSGYESYYNTNKQNIIID